MPWLFLRAPYPPEATFQASAGDGKQKSHIQLMEISSGLKLVGRSTSGASLRWEKTNYCGRLAGRCQIGRLPCEGLEAPQCFMENTLWKMCYVVAVYPVYLERVHKGFLFSFHVVSVDFPPTYVDFQLTKCGPPLSKYLWFSVPMFYDFKLCFQVHHILWQKCQVCLFFQLVGTVGMLLFATLCTSPVI